MDLGLDLFRTHGRARQPITATVLRDLEPSDIAMLGQEKGSIPSPIKRISERHHALARNLALGMDHKQAAVIANYSESRISILLNDPAFKELLEFYREPFEDVVRDTGTLLAGLAKDAAEELSLRLEEDSEKFSNGQLMELTKLGADRTGFGPQSSQTNVNVNVDLASRLQQARQRVAQRTIEGIAHVAEDQ
jgi:hypothetical protein